MKAGQQSDARSFFEACRTGNLRRVMQLSKVGIDLEIRDAEAEEETGLILAAEKGHKTVVSFLLSANANPNATSMAIPGGGGRESALYRSCRNGHLIVAKDLIAAGAKVNIRAYTGTPLHAAVEGNHVNVVKFLLSVGADVLLTDSGVRQTPLHSSAFLGSLELVNLLLENGAALDPQDKSGMTPLMVAAWQKHESVMHLLLERGANLGLRQQDGTTHLIWVVRSGAIGVVKELLKRRVPLDERDDVGATALRHARNGRFRGITKLLLSHGAHE